MASAKVIWEDVLNDLLVLGSLAAGLFVKNPAHQQTAAGVIKATGAAIQLVTSQMNEASGTNTVNTATSSVNHP